MFRVMYEEEEESKFTRPGQDGLYAEAQVRGICYEVGS